MATQQDLQPLELTGDDLSLETVYSVAYSKRPVKIANTVYQKMETSRNYIQGRMDSGDIMYGVNTGFGAFSSVRISNEDTVQLQKNLIRSHCCGVGPLFSLPDTRAMMLLRANALARGHSGVRVAVVEKIIEFLNKDIVPCVPEQGSVGASGDLAPLAHLALALIGEGEVWYQGAPQSFARVASALRIEPLTLQAKEGLSLINGCQVMTAVGLVQAFRARNLLWHLDLAGAMSLEALKGSRSAFDPLIFATRPHPGEAKTARNVLNLLGPKSEISESHTGCNKVQDAYSLRCIPAVHGAAKVALQRAVETLEIEANSSTDNPLVFAEANKVLSCGNFHGEPVAFVLDYLAIAMAAAGSISECRIAKLVNPAMSDLPAFLAMQGGLNSGLMMVQVAAASLVSENKILAHPASVDSIPTSADKEDHVSMGTIAARKLRSIVDNVENIVAMELLTAAQGLDFLLPLRPASGVFRAYQELRKSVSFAAEDRVFSKDIALILNLLRSNSLISFVDSNAQGRDSQKPATKAFAMEW